MKSILFSLFLSLCSFNLFAETNDRPIGFEKMLNVLSEVTSPNEAVGKTFLLSTPFGKEKNTLHILPESAAETLSLGQGNYRVRILKAEPFYDMDFFNDTGSISLNEVMYSWTNGGTVGPDIKDSQECINKIKFEINGKEFNQESLNKYKISNTPYKFEYNRSVLKQSTENDFTFTRISNDPTTVTLILYKKDGSIYTKMESSPVSTCNQLPVKKETYIWSAWGEFNSCSATCGGGTQSRTRTCLTEDSISCVGNAYEERACNIQECQVAPMTAEQKKQLKQKGVTLNIVSNSNVTLLKPKGIANYEAALTNPFSRTISCDVSITSSRGYNQGYQTIDHKTHIAVVVPANGVTKVNGVINIMRGHSDTGLSWADGLYQGNTYFADNCRFLN